MQTVQLAIRDSGYAAALGGALARNGPWRVERVDAPDAGKSCVLVMDEESLSRTPLPLVHPERVVLITCKNPHPESMSNAWNAGILSLVSTDDSVSTVLLAIMAAGLRLSQRQATAPVSAISPRKHKQSCVNIPETPSDRSATTANTQVSEFRIMDSSVQECYFQGGVSMDASLAELEAVVRNYICGVCSDRMMDGTCGLEEPAGCALFRLFPQVAQAIQSTHSDDIQDYIDAIRRNVCTVCAAQDSEGHCGPRQQVQCALDAYLLLVVEVIEDATGKTFSRRGVVQLPG